MFCFRSNRSMVANADDGAEEQRHRSHVVYLHATSLCWLQTSRRCLPHIPGSCFFEAFTPFPTFLCVWSCTLWVTLGACSTISWCLSFGWCLNWFMELRGFSRTECTLSLILSFSLSSQSGARPLSLWRISSSDSVLSYCGWWQLLHMQGWLGWWWWGCIVPRTTESGTGLGTRDMQRQAMVRTRN